jgi:hypothetical protein
MSDGQLVRRSRSSLRSTWSRGFITVGIAAAITIALAGCVPSAKHTNASVRTHHSVPATADPTPTPSTPTATPNPTESHPATPGPVSAAFPSPTITPIPRGTVVASGNVASPKGSVHFHYAMVANGNNTFSAEYSGFTSTVPVPISVTLLDVAPNVGDGLTYHGVGDHQLGGPTTAAAPASSVALNSVGPPSYLGTLVTYSSATSANGIPVELGPNKVLAVSAVHWAIPLRQTNVHPADGGTRAYASGTVTAKTTTGAPKHYLVAPGDVTAVVAERFGISVQDLIWLNANLEVFGDQQYLYEGTTLNLDPNSL